MVVDGTSTDKTVEIVKKFGAKILVKDNPSMFHINKQKTIDAATGEWILQLDADERVSPELAEEIKKKAVLFWKESTKEKIFLFRILFRLMIELGFV